MKWPYRTSAAIVLGLLCSIFFLIGIITYKTSAQFVENNRLQNNAFIVLKKFEIVLNCLTDAETSQRGYIITGNESYLKPYHTAVANIDREFNELRQLVKNNPEHMQRLDALEPLIAEKLGGINERIVIRKNKGFEAAAREVRTGKGMVAMDKIRNIIDKMEGEERSMLRQNIAETEKSGRNALFIIIFGSSLSFVIVTIANIFTYQELKKRKQAEDVLLKAHDELEHRVEERTKELRESEVKFRTLAETSIAAIFIHEGEKFIYVNPMMESITGYNKKELLEMNFWDTVHPDFKDLVRERGFSRQRAEAVPSEYEFKMFRKDSEERWHRIHATSFHFEGKRAALGTAFDITEQKKAEEQLHIYQNRLRYLAAEVTLFEEHERRRIAADLHDHVIQMLALCNIRMQTLKESLGNSQRKAVDEIGEFLQQAINYSRSLVSELSPQILYTLGLEAAIEWLGENLLEKNGIKFQFQNDGQSKPLKDDIQIILFLTVRELMFNIVKHSKASEAKVSIQKHRDNYEIVIEDNGIGFDTSKILSPVGRGFGLFNIREQLYSIGGQLKVGSGQGISTYITILVRTQ